MALYVQVPREVFRVETLKLRGLEAFFTAEYQIMLGVRTKKVSLQTVRATGLRKENVYMFLLNQ